jgi:hypothetical protein
VKSPIRELVVSLAVRVYVVINSQKPFGVFLQSVGLNEGIFVLRRRLMFAPRVPLVVDESTFLDELLGKRICGLVQFTGIIACCHLVVLIN